MQTIHKYRLQKIFGPRQLVAMPIGAKILAADLQDTELCVWAEVDEELADINTVHQLRTFYVLGTGHPIPEKNLKHIATIVMHGLVFHVYLGGVAGETGVSKRNDIC